MAITEIKPDSIWAEPNAWIFSIIFVSLIMLGFIIPILFNGYRSNKEAKANNEKPTGRPYLAASLIFIGVSAIFIPMMMFMISTPHSQYLYEGSVSSVSELTPDSPVGSTVTLTMEELGTLLYVNATSDTLAAIQSTEGGKAALLCKNVSLGRHSPTVISCDLLRDLPGSTELEEFKKQQ